MVVLQRNMMKLMARRKKESAVLPFQQRTLNTNQIRVIMRMLIVQGMLIMLKT